VPTNPVPFTPSTPEQTEVLNTFDASTGISSTPIVAAPLPPRGSLAAIGSELQAHTDSVQAVRSKEAQLSREVCAKLTRMKKWGCVMCWANPQCDECIGELKWCRSNPEDMTRQKIYAWIKSTFRELHGPCYGCFLKAEDGELHDGRVCRFKDMVTHIAFVIWGTPTLRSALASEFGLPSSSADDVLAFMMQPSSIQRDWITMSLQVLDWWYMQGVGLQGR
jgi:hypothetical protein